MIERFAEAVYNPYLQFAIGAFMCYLCMTSYLLFISISRSFKAQTIESFVLFSIEIVCILMLKASINIFKGMPYVQGSGMIISITLILILLLHIPPVRAFVKKNRNTVTNMSIKDSFYSVSVGLCFYLESGMCRCINPIMNRISMETMGMYISNGLDFWNRIRHGDFKDGVVMLQSGDRPIIKLGSGKVYLFSNQLTRFGEQKIYELKALDITEEYTLTDELIRDNNRLTEQNTELQKYSDIVAALIVEKEVLDTKISIHDNIGKILLATRHYLNTGGDSFDKEELIRYWTSMTRLNADDKAQASDDNAMEELEKAADSIGVKVSVEGHFPSDNEKKRIILIGAMECLLNASKHAGATEMTIRISDSNGKTVIEYTNNGKAPETTVTAGGGLSFVNENVKAAGGIMEIEVMPVFKLKIIL